MSYFVYKCNATGSGLGQESGDWSWVFDDPWETVRWGTVAKLKGLGDIRKGDVLLCSQSKPQPVLVGVARAMGIEEAQLLVRPVERIGARIRPLKDADPRIAAIPALQGGPVRSAYPISESDAGRLLRAARAKPAPARWRGSDDRIVKTTRARLRELPLVERQIALREIRLVVRNALLRRAVLGHWPAECAACGSSIREGERAECEVAHIRDVHQRGADQVRNALPLCRTHHWAFDALLWAIRPTDRRIVVRKSQRRNASLKPIHGRTIKVPRSPTMPLLDQDALAWRWKRFVAAASSDL
jgi:hypothetical protein